jgi:hypothetical protein
MNLAVGLSGPDLIAILGALRDLKLAGQGLPEVVLVDNKRRPPAADWFEKWTAKTKVEMFAGWDQQFSRFLSYHPGTIVKAAGEYSGDAGSVTAMIAGIPFTLGSFRSLFNEWYRGDGYGGCGFADLHFPHGWACAFRGAGHDRLVSRRWLDFGPWRVVRGPGDTTLVQFHDLNADAATALEQARPGHERMGISDTGGFIQSGYVYEHQIGGIYVAADRKLRIVVHRRDVSQGEMLDACAVRYYQGMGPGKPVDNIAYVFMEEAPARAHLHELWLRGLECWAIIAGREVRLDEDYHPAPEKPAWVVQVEGA